METALTLAIKNNCYNTFDNLVQAGASIFVSNQNGRTPLMFAASQQNGRFVWRLLQAIVSKGHSLSEMVNKRDNSGNTALMEAAVHGLTQNLTILIHNGAEVNIVNDKGESALCFAAIRGRENSLRILINNGAILNMKDKHGLTALAKAAIHGHSNIVDILAEAGANVNLPDKAERSPLMWATIMGQKNCCNSLVQRGASVDQTDRDGNTVLMKAAVPYFYDKLEALKSIDTYPSDLLKDTNNKQVNEKIILQILVDAGADLNKSNSKGATAVILASMLEDNGSLLNILLDAGANANLTDHDGDTALMNAVTHCEMYENVKVLLEKGADINVQNKKGMTALMLASSYRHLQLLLEGGADVNLTDSYGRTALMVVAGKRLDDDDDFSSFTCRESLFSLFISAGAKVDSQDTYGKSALMKACSKRMTEHVHVLLKMGADVNLQDHHGRTALFYNIISLVWGKYDDDNEGDDDCEYDDSLDLIWQDDDYRACVTNLLTNHGADVNIRDVHGMTALMIVARSKYWASAEVAEILMSHQACLDLLDNEGKSALVHALERCDSEEICNLIEYFLFEDVFPKLRSLAAISPNLLDLEYIYLSTYKRYRSRLYEIPEATRLRVCNGIMTIGEKMCSYYNCDLLVCNDDKTWSPLLLLQAIIHTRNGLAVAKYLIANCYLTTVDIARVRDDSRPISVYGDVLGFLREAFSQPWPLVKLAQLAVSTAIGPSPGRRERILRTGLPRPIMDCLMFDRPIALLHHDWEDIPMFFDPDEYTSQPAPYPLLYNWPFGHNVVSCDCDVCTLKDPKFRFTKIHISGSVHQE